MPQIYEKTVKELLKELIDERLKSEGDTIARDEVRAWFQQHYAKIKPATIGCHLTLLSTNHRSRVHYGLRPDGSDDLLFQIDGNRFRRYRAGADSPPIYKSSGPVPSVPHETDEDGEDVTTSAFAYEEDLRDYLAKSLHLVEAGLNLHRDGEITGVEYPAGGMRRIDILAVDKAGALVVIELKVSRGYDRVVGQLLRYMAWIRENLAEIDQPVRGIIIAKDITEDLRLAASGLPGVSLIEYTLAVTLKPVGP